MPGELDIGVKNKEKGRNGDSVPFCVWGGASSPPARGRIRAPGGTAFGGTPGGSKVLPDGKNQLRTELAYYALCAVRPVFRPAYSSKRLGYRASPLRISDSGVSVGLLSLNSPLDCPEPNARPTGLRPSIHPHPSITHRASSSRKPGVPVGLLSPNSPLDCPETNARPSGFALHAPPSPTAPSALGKAFGCVLN